MTLIFQVVCALFSGILSALSIPNELFEFGSAFLGFFALVPLYFAVKNAKSYKVAALLFAIDALTTHLLSSHWLANFKDFAIFTLGASAFGTACIEAMAGCLYFFPFAGAGTDSCLKIGGKKLSFEAFRPLHFAAVRVAYEWAKSTGFLAYPWGVLSMSAFNSKALLQSADIFGTYGISFMAAFFAACVAEFFLTFNKYAFWPQNSAQNARFNLLCSVKCLALCLILLFAYGTFKLCQKSPAQKVLNAVLVQQNMDPWASDDDIESVKKSIDLTRSGIKEFEEQGKKTDLVVWSEAVLRYAMPKSLGRYNFVPVEENLLSFIKNAGVPFVIGGPYVLDAEKSQMANAALVFDKDSNLRGYYGKSHLVPFAEAIPFTESPLVKKFMNAIVGFSNGWTPGKRLVLFDFDASQSPDADQPLYHDLTKAMEDDDTALKAKVRTALPICFEDAFPDTCGPMFKAGAELFLNITDDSWSKTYSAERQHFAVAAFRAVEYRTSLARSTNAGLTAVVDDKGRIVQSIPLFEDGWLCAQIPVFKRRATVYSAFGNWFALLILILIAAAAVCKAREFKAPTLCECVRTELEKIEF